MLRIELKTVPALNAARRGQCVNYLKATGVPLCLLFNFGNPRLEIKRVANRLSCKPFHLRASARIF